MKRRGQGTQAVGDRIGKAALGILLALPLSWGILARSGRCEVRTAQTMDEILKGADADTLVVFDVDNTLMRPLGQFGSDQFYDYLEERAYERLKRRQLPDEQARREAILSATADWVRIQKGLSVEAVEPQTPQLIAGLQAKGVMIMGLTARPAQLAELTLRKLKEDVKINLAASAPGRAAPLMVPASELGGAENAVYRDGLISQGETNHKGRVLRAFLAKLGLKPKKIIFVDDKPKNASRVNDALAETGIEHVEYVYNGGRARIDEFKKDPTAALSKEGVSLEAVLAKLHAESGALPKRTPGKPALRPETPIE